MQPKRLLKTRSKICLNSSHSYNNTWITSYIGDSEKFFEAYNPALDYNNFQIAESDVGIQRAVLSQYFQAKGHGAEFINEMLEDYQDTGKLHGKAEAARVYSDGEVKNMSVRTCWNNSKRCTQTRS